MFIKKRFFEFLSVLLAVLMVISLVPLSVLAADGEGVEDEATVTEMNEDESTVSDVEVGQDENLDSIDNIIDDAILAEEVDVDTESFVGDEIQSTENVEVLMYEAAGVVQLVESGSYDNISWKVYDTDSDGIGDQLIVSGTGDMCEPLFNLDSWNKWSDSVTSVIINKGITGVSFQAFRNWTNIVTVQLPEGITYIWAYAFSGCNNLKSINIPSTVNILESCCFFNCESLESIVLPDGISEIGYKSFDHCSSLKSINIPKGVTKIESFAFDKCTSLTSIELPDGLTTIEERAFIESGLTSIKIPGSVTNIEEMTFEKCSSLKSVELCDGITSIDRRAFNLCGSLTEVKIPDSVTSIGEQAFYGCNSLESVIIPKGVLSIGESAFNGCSSLKNVELQEGLTNIDKSAFKGCSNLQSINFPKSLTSIGESAFYHCSSINNIVIPEGITTIDRYTFYLCENLENVVLPEGLVSIGEHAFFRCRSLKKLKLPDGLTDIKDYAFYDCSGIVSLELPKSVINIGKYAFWSCSNLEGDIELPSALNIEYGAFLDCDKLDSIIFSNPETQISNNSYPRPSMNSKVMLYVVKDSSVEEVIKAASLKYGQHYRYVEECDINECVELDSASLTIDGSISLNFYFRLTSSLINDTNAYILVGDAKYPVSKLSKVDGSKYIYKISYPVSAKNIKDDYSFAVYNGNGVKQELYNSNFERVNDDIYRYSVYKYCQSIINGDYNKTQKDLANAIITYGECAMDYFGYGDIGSTPPSVEEMPQLTSFEETTYSGTMPPNITYVGSSLLLKSNIKMRFYFIVDDATILTKYTFKMNAERVNLVQYANGSNIYYIETPEILNNKLWGSVSVSISDSKNIYYIRTSPLAYMSSAKMLDNEKLRNLCSALYWLYKSIKY